jgi:predicted Zn-dependent protease
MSTARALLKRLTAAGLALALPLLTACATAPATGDQIFTGGLSMQQEKKLGAEQHPKLLRQFGGAYDDRELSRYVSSVGTLLAQTSELPDLDWTFTVLDTPVVNAFALPGGYVYVSRGLLALAENEAQMAGVLAHEIGHVTARHAAERYGGQQMATIGSLLAGVLLGGEAAQVAGGLSQVALAGYSRSQELEADTLGVRYLARAGYDPQAMAAFLERMQAEQELQQTLAGVDGGDGFNMLSTHPRTPQRVQEAIRAAGVRQVAEPMTAREIYLSKLDGMVYGHSPSQGFVRGTRFLHPELRLAFEVPRSFRILNQQTRVVARGPGGSAIVFDRAPGRVGGDIAAYLVNRWAEGGRLREVQRLTLDGMPAATGVARARTSEGPRDVRLLAIRWDRETVYRFLFLHPARGDLSSAFLDTAESFRRLSAAEAGDLAPRRIRLHEVQPGERVADLARRLPYDDYRERRFRVLNGLGPGAALQAGQTVKLVQ